MGTICSTDKFYEAKISSEPKRGSNIQSQYQENKDLLNKFKFVKIKSKIFMQSKELKQKLKNEEEIKNMVKMKFYKGNNILSNVQNLKENNELQDNIKLINVMSDDSIDFNQQIPESIIIEDSKEYDEENPFTQFNQNKFSN